MHFCSQASQHNHSYGSDKLLRSAYVDIRVDIGVTATSSGASLAVPPYPNKSHIHIRSANRTPLFVFLFDYHEGFVV